MTFAALAGLAAGIVHVLAGPDHLAAVAPLAADHRQPQWRTGLQWGLGHTAGVVLIGLLLLTFRQVLPVDAISAYSERIVGVALVAVGLWALRRARLPASGSRLPATGSRRTAHSHSVRSAGRGWRVERASFAMGALHGLAGSSHLFGILPALALPTNTDAVTYLAGFGAGAILAMTAFAGVVGMLAARAGQRGLVTHKSVLYACSFSALVVGSFWLVS